MKTKKLKTRKKATSGWAETDVKAALKERAFYRAMMDRVRLTDVANELAAPEKISRRRVELLQDLVNPSGSDPDTDRWGALERRELAMAHMFANLREKIGWVLQP